MSGCPGNVVAGTTGGKGKGKDLNVHDANATETGTGLIAPSTQGHQSCFFNDFVTDAVVNQWVGKKTLDPNRPPPISLTYGAGPVIDYRIDDWSNPYIQNTSYLEGYPATEMAEYIMKWVSKMTTPIMQRHGWTVDHLSEFYPPEAGLLGTNYFAGRFVVVRLREYWDWNVFRDPQEILSTMIHELCHNSYSEHNPDFYHLWNDLNHELGQPGAAGGEAELHASMYPKNPLPEGHIAISTGGQKILMTSREWQMHFSAYAATYTHQIEPIFHIPRAFYPCVVIRLVQLAKGLDPADDIPLAQVSNCRSYWNDEFGRLTVWDGFWESSRYSQHALELYLSMYKTGEALGWHASSRAWLTKRLDRYLRWVARLGPGPWQYPPSANARARTSYLRHVVRRLYDDTTAQDQAVRGVVTHVMSKVFRMHLKEIDLSKTAEARELQYDVNEIEEIKRSTPALLTDIIATLQPKYQQHFQRKRGT